MAREALLIVRRLIASKATEIGAPDDMEPAHRAQAWLAAIDDAAPLAVGNPQ
jgi:hypothetical protein